MDDMTCKYLQEIIATALYELEKYQIVISYDNAEEPGYYNTAKYSIERKPE